MGATPRFRDNPSNSITHVPYISCVHICKLVLSIANLGLCVTIRLVFLHHGWTALLMPTSLLFLLLAALTLEISGLPYTEGQIPWNLNHNPAALSPSEYWGECSNHTYHPSPDNWRIPTYVLALDRYVDGDPTNNEANGTVFEHDWTSNQFRFGGDTKGLMRYLDLYSRDGYTGWSVRTACITPH